MRISTLKAYGLAATLGLGVAVTQGVAAQTADCNYVLVNNWGGGATAAIEITNTGSSAISGWSVGWSYTNNVVTSSWNANVTGNNPYSATNLGWNGSLQPGQTVSFGVQVNTNGTAETPRVTGSICRTAVSSAASSVRSSVGGSSRSSAIGSATNSSSSRTLSSSSAPAASSSCATSGQQCNWYGTHYPLCSNVQSGWGWENQRSCIGRSTCSGQPAPHGIVGAGSCPVSSAASSVISSRSSSSSSPRSISSSSRPSSSPGSSSSARSSAGGVTSVQLTKLMGVGWNLGNTLDAVGGETAWGNPRVTQQLINSVKAAGFDTIRIPVAWSQFSDPANFVIQNAWLARVEEVVNYALNADMYIILNIHWDGGWMQPTYAQQDYVNNRLAIMWRQIATRFRNYDDRLLFAGTNEVMVDGDYGTPTVEYYTVQNSFNQTFVDSVRATGGANASRHLVVQGFNTNIDHTINFADVPDDSVRDRLLMEVHYYDPYNFTLNATSNITQWGSIATNPAATETWANESYVDATFQRMKVNFVDRGIGVILGEYGVASRPNVAGHEIYRRYWNEYITRSALSHDMVPVYWDNGYAGDGGFALFNRATGSESDPALVDVIVNAAD